MARAQFINDPAFELAMSKVGSKFPEVAEKALKAGAGVIANEMKKRLKSVLSNKATGQLVAAFGITPVRQDKNFNYNTHLGFDGYQRPGYGKFESTGVPCQLIARTIESGAGTGRLPKPFAKPAVNASKQEAFAVMKKTAEDELIKIMKGR